MADPLDRDAVERRQALLKRERRIAEFERVIAEHPDEFGDEMRALVASMKSPPTPRPSSFRITALGLSRQWQANESRLERLYAGPPLDSGFREIQIEELEGTQDWIEWVLGKLPELPRSFSWMP
jgi:hypothetical protein